MRAPVGWDGRVILILRMACNPADLLEPSVGTCALERRWFWASSCGTPLTLILQCDPHTQPPTDAFSGPTNQGNGQSVIGCRHGWTTASSGGLWLFSFLLSCVCVCVWVCVLPMCRLLRGCLSVSSLHVSRISSARIEPDSRISCRAIPIGWLRLPEIPLFRWDRHLSSWRMEAFLSLLVRFVLLDLLPNFQINWQNKFQFTRDQDKGQCCYSNGLSKSN